MSSEANAVGGKTARACDSCIRKRARWYCAADDAFLCQSCDSSVHSANPLARRHQRLRLKTASYKSTQQATSPTWHIKKPRTPRHGKHSRNPFFHLVPQLPSEDTNSHDDNDLLYRVPIFDPQLSATISSPSSVTSTDHQRLTVAVPAPSQLQQNLHGILPSDAELAEFAADVETLLGRGLENECVGMDDLGLVDAIEEDFCSVASDNVKIEDQLESPHNQIIARDQSFQFISFDYETCQDFDLGEANENQRNNISLQLDYEAVILAWATHKSPWTTGHKPNMDPDQCWHQCMGTAFHNPYGGFGIHPVMFDGGREARVSRYREKRRTRLFSKKIRYEVRKLNAEKRPRMKGRFVKRASFPPPTFPNLK